MPIESDRRQAESFEDSLTWAQIHRYVEAPLRRPLLVAIPWVAVIVASIAALFVLPKRYKSSTLIFVESEKMPDTFVPKVATEDRSARLEAIRPEILSRTRLERVLDETDPYPDQPSKTQAVEKMRSATSINVSGSDGFSITYVHSDPHKAQQVATRLATLFIEETIKAREQQVEGAVDFLVGQVRDARKELDRKDEALRLYKQAHMGRLPEQLQTNLATMGMLQRELQTIEESLLFARERQQSLTRGASRSPAGATEGGGSQDGADLPELRRQLASLTGRYTEDHPDVQRLKVRIARLEAQPRTAAALPPVDAATRDEVERAALETKRLDDKRVDLERRIASMRANVEDTPRTEQELSTLTRDYQKLNENYTALLAKQLEAQMAGRVEQRWKGDRFRMMDPANLPEKPYFPRPVLILALGAFVGLLVGLGVAMGAEYLDTTIKLPEDLTQAQAYPVLACIPHLTHVAGSAHR